MLEKNKRIIIFGDTWKLYYIQMSVSTNEDLLEPAMLICLCIAYGCFPTTKAE